MEPILDENPNPNQSLPFPQGSYQGKIVALLN